MDATTTASKTALMVCAYRARESKADRPLFVDPWADAIAGAEGQAIADRLDARWPPMALWLALRVAYLDRLVGQAVDQLSIRQVVILGAGYDTRAARLPRAGVRFFEVDHPATQAEKRARLATLPDYPIEAATYTSCNFEREDPIERLVACGFDPLEPALVLWEGVTMYLTEAAVRTTATRLARGLAPRSLVAFDHLGKRMAAGQVPQRDLHSRDFVGELGEPVQWGMDDPLPLLYDAGFRWVRSIDFNQIALELVGDYQRDRQFRFVYIALAAMQPPVAQWP